MHLLYVDESGDDSLPAQNGGKIAGSPIFSRVGIALHDKKWRGIDAKMRGFRHARNIPNNEELHAAEVVFGKTQKNVKTSAGWKKQKFLNWFGQTIRHPEQRRKLLEQLLLDVLDPKHITIFAVVIEKKHIDVTLPPSPNRNPKFRSLELLSERFTHHIDRQIDKNGLIIMDSVNLVDDTATMKFQNELYQRSRYVSGDRFVENIMFCPSHTTNLLQLADVCSYGLYRYVVHKDPFLFDILKKCLHRNDGGKVDGAGLKYWPEPLPVPASTQALTPPKPPRKNKITKPRHSRARSRSRS